MDAKKLLLVSVGSVLVVIGVTAFLVLRHPATFARTIGGEDLSEVLKRHKDAGVIQSPQVGIAQSYLKFRNDSLHAYWDKIGRESIHSVLGIRGAKLLLKHFV